MSDINDVKQYDSGYKTLSAKEVGWHARVSYNIINHEHLPPSCKLIYAFLLSYKKIDSDDAIVSYDLLRKKTGYSFQTLRESINMLEHYEFIKIRKRINGADARKIYNIYTFLKIDKDFAQITHKFLESTLLSTKEKEFILLIFPFLLPNDALGSLKEPANYSWLGMQIGLDRVTVSKRIRSLKKKMLVKDYYSRYGNNEEYEIVGWKFDMDAIMLDAQQNIVKERNEYYYTCKDYGLLK